MTREDIKNDIASLLRQNRCRLDNVNEQTEIQNFDMDSLRLTGFLMDMEDFFKVLVPDREWERWNNVGDIIDYILNYLESAVNLSTMDLELTSNKMPDIPER